ncbi:unnamed protein product [Ectocarpus sp. 13 AM-2016]
MGGCPGLGQDAFSASLLIDPAAHGEPRPTRPVRMAGGRQLEVPRWLAGPWKRREGVARAHDNHLWRLGVDQPHQQ